MVLNGVWLRKNMVQSSRCRSAPSGSIRLARSLSGHQSWGWDGGVSGSPLISAERLWKLVGELSPTINVEFGEQDE
jgi:hypothetical protein